MAGAAPFFLQLERGNRFCVLHTPAGEDCRGAVLYVHPFAEELNRSRRMAALQARAFRAAGWSVLQIDLFGCGDSAGDLADATWQQWIDDLIQASRWLRQETGQQPALWGLRAGCLLAAQVAPILASTQILLWQPVVSGRLFLQQFLRLRVGSQIVSNASATVSVKDLRQQLEHGQSVEVAGYTVSPDLAASLDAAELQPPTDTASVVWLEVSPSQQTMLTPASEANLAKWRACGHTVVARALRGAQFWQTQEITEASELIGCTLEAIDAW